jgi:hypothetical protein
MVCGMFAPVDVALPAGSSLPGAVTVCPPRARLDR